MSEPTYLIRDDWLASLTGSIDRLMDTLSSMISTDGLIMDRVAGLEAENQELREGLAALSNRIEGLTRRDEGTGLGHCGNCGSSVTLFAACSVCGFAGPHRAGESVRVLRQP